MSEKIKAVWIGAFILAALVILGWFIFLLKPYVGDGKTVLQVRFANIDKIAPGTRVLFAGKPVGEVYKIHEIPNARDLKPNENKEPYFWQLTLKVDSRVKIYDCDEIVFASSGLMGERSIAIIPKANGDGNCGTNVTGQILYAKGGDKFDVALNSFKTVALSLDKTLSTFNSLLEDNKTEICETIQSFHCASAAMNEMFSSINDSHLIDVTAEAVECLGLLLDQAIGSNLVDHMDIAVNNLTKLTEEDGIVSNTMANLNLITNQLISQQGTIGQLIYNDAFYLQLMATLGRVETLAGDISDYGLLFQFDKAWKRKRDCRMNKINTMCNTSDFYRYFNQELCEINVGLSKVAMIMDSLGGSPDKKETTDLYCQFQELHRKVKCLEEQVTIYMEKFCCY